MAAKFHNREQAGERLAALLGAWRRAPGAVVLALPRGGVPVAAEVARTLGLSLDVLVVRKLGFPGHEEYALGAIAAGGIRVMNTATLPAGLSTADLDAVAEREQAELERREALYRQGRPALELAGRTAIVVDDGLATGATMRAAVAALRRRQAAHIVVAVPVGDAQACAALRQEANEVVCVLMPQPLHAVGVWYDDFAQVPDRAVQQALAAATSSP